MALVEEEELENATLSLAKADGRVRLLRVDSQEAIPLVISGLDKNDSEIVMTTVPVPSLGRGAVVLDVQEQSFVLAMKEA